MIQRITVHTIYQSMIRFHRFFSQRRNIYFAEMSNFGPLISIWKELKNLPELYPSSTMFDNFFSIKKCTCISTLPVSNFMRHQTHKAQSRQVNNKSINTFVYS